MPRSYQGTGTRFVGERDYQRDGSYVTTEFVTLFLVPLIPLRSYRVREVSSEAVVAVHRHQTLDRYEIVAKLPHPNWIQVTSVYATAGACVCMLVFGTPNLQGRGPWDGFAGDLAGYAVIWAPLLVTWFLRRRARERARAEPETTVAPPT